jgi:perosamine synthetase
VVETLKSGWLTTGPKTKQFEQNFGKYVGATHSIAVNSATAALHVALDAVGVSDGDEVIVPTMTFAATAEVVIHLGAKPVLVDCQPDTFNMDPRAFEAAITPRTKAVTPVHYGGQPCDMDPILEIARGKGIKVLEDAAHALPTKYRGRMVGAIGDITCFSFYANKTITTGEGGMITTENAEWADRMNKLALHGLSKDAWKRFSAEGSWYYEIVLPGYKYNLTDIASAIGLHQLEKSDRYWQRRKECAEFYNRRLAKLSALELPVCRDDVQHAWHLYVVQLNLDQLKVTRSQFIELLTEAGIGTSVHYLPLHMHPLYREEYGYQPGDLPVAQGIYERIVSLPVYPRMTDEDLDYVCDTIERIVTEQKR